MRGAPHRQARSSARSFVLLPSVLALLALALFPVLARAESAEKVYEVEVPSVQSEPSTTAHHKAPTHNESSNNPQAHSSAAETGGGKSSGKPGAEQPESEESHKSSGAATSNGGGNNPPKGGGEGGNSSKSGGNAKPEDNLSEGRAVPATESHSSGGSSSPVVPILIAVAVLAAISIGVVLYRQRKSAAGPDGHVSSPDAS